MVGPEQLRSELGNASLAQRAVQGSTPCLIQLTSGSSGVPRGVVLSHGNLASQQAAYAMLWPEVGPGDRIAAYLPWHHSFGGQAERLWALLRGAEVHLVPGGGRDRVRFCATLSQVAPTLFLSVPKMHAVALQEGLFRPRQLRWAFTAGATLPETCWQGYEQLAIRVYEGWGLTESSPSAAITVPGQPRIPGVIGPPIPGVAVGVEEGSGRIFIHGPNVMLGYAGGAGSPLLPCELGGVMLESGDLGAWDAAGLRLLGREDCMLKLGNGEKVWAPLIEAAVIQRHPHALVLVEDGVLACVIEAPMAITDAQLVECVASANAAIEASCQRIVRLYRLQEAMSVENGMLTASLKIARGAVTQAWRDWHLHGGRPAARAALAGGAARILNRPGAAPVQLRRPSPPGEAALGAGRGRPASRHAAARRAPGDANG